MNGRRAPRLPWSLWVFCLVLTVVATLIPTQDFPLAAVVLVGLWLDATATVGALIASKRPENPIGWIMLAIGLTLLISALARQYATHALFLRPGLLPMGQTFAWVSSWLPIPGFALLALLLLLFPTGRLPSQRWRWVLRVGLGGTTVLIIATAFDARPLAGLGGDVPNPLGLPGVTDVLSPLANWSSLVTAVCGLSAITSPFLRLHRATAVERQQIKWFGLAAGFASASWMLGTLFFESVSNPLLDSLLGFLLPIAGLSAMPVAIGIAVLRYRLYDIDVIINRALVYGALTATLATVYILGVVGVGGLVQNITGQHNNSLVVVATTLVVAALFRPIRAHIQDLIDKRFYRRKYDATKAIEHSRGGFEKRPTYLQFALIF